jgi:uncharacterized protein with PQ loop repeat
MPSLVDVVTWIFVATNACRLFAYLPQVLAALRCQNGAAAVSRITWGYFALAHLTGHVYSLLVLHDVKMALVLLGNFLACAALVGIVSWKRRPASVTGRVGLGPGHQRLEGSIASQ